ncbi:RAD51-associated protein 1 isoform X2 [Eucyclogobius newberryi]|uniref:RAD51-associated protein 1 isoform X2 n=1 Tax=Eucyclogobius newberryi TaxID=166745 RepID=UPI003B594A9F
MDGDRPSRKTKSVNYCESKNFEDDDEDFAFQKSPPGKKAKEMVKQQKSSQESNARSLTSEKCRKPVDVKILERDLEAAISLSMLNTPCETSNPSSALQDENREPSCLSQHLSNCSVDTMRLGLDQITTDSNATSKEMNGAPAIQRNKQKAQDDEYQPCVISDSESDNDYSEHDSEDEEFTVKKASKTKKEKVTKNGKAKQPPASAKKDKPKCTVASTPTRTPLTNKNTSDLSSSASSSKASKSAACLSPATSRVPKWNPPGQIGKSPSSNSLPGRSPGQGLRLGLSRLVRVKPLHPSVSSH